MPENIEGTQQHLRICHRTKSNLTRLTCTPISPTANTTTNFTTSTISSNRISKTPRGARARTQTGYTFGSCDQHQFGIGRSSERVVQSQRQTATRFP
ncbi:hypothetical protein V8C43DRAFT_293328 [Trichoderma afarasin]